MQKNILEKINSYRPLQIKPNESPDWSGLDEIVDELELIDINYEIYENVIKLLERFSGSNMLNFGPFHRIIEFLRNADNIDAELERSLIDNPSFIILDIYYNNLKNIKDERSFLIDTLKFTIRSGKANLDTSLLASKYLYEMTNELIQPNINEDSIKFYGHLFTLMEPQSLIGKNAESLIPPSNNDLKPDISVYSEGYLYSFFNNGVELCVDFNNIITTVCLYNNEKYFGTYTGLFPSDLSFESKTEQLVKSFGKPDTITKNNIRFNLSDFVVVVDFLDKTEVVSSITLMDIESES